MAIVTGEARLLRAAATYAAVGTYYKCTNEITVRSGGDSLMLTVACTVKASGITTFKVERYDKVLGAFAHACEVAVTLAKDDVASIPVPFVFLGGDRLRVRFKAAAEANEAKLAISGTCYAAPAVVVVAASEG